MSDPPVSRPVTPPPGGRTLASDTVEIIQPSQYGDRRAEPRVVCDGRGALVLAGREVVTCRILDQSPSGARIAFDKLDDLPAEIWMIDLDQSTARRGTAAWSTLNRMGLKFDLIQHLVPGAPCPPKVPKPVHAAWLGLTGHAPGPEAGDDDVLYFD